MPELISDIFYHKINLVVIGLFLDVVGVFLLWLDHIETQKFGRWAFVRKKSLALPDINQENQVEVIMLENGLLNRSLQIRLWCIRIGGYSLISGFALQIYGNL